MARFRAVGGPIAQAPAPPAVAPSPNGVPVVPEEKPAEAPGEISEPRPGGSAAFPADQEIPIRE